jgi:hypothetical protein
MREFRQAMKTCYYGMHAVYKTRKSAKSRMEEQVPAAGVVRPSQYAYANWLGQDANKMTRNYTRDRDRALPCFVCNHGPNMVISGPYYQKKSVCSPNL